MGSIVYFVKARTSTGFACLDKCSNPVHWGDPSGEIQYHHLQERHPDWQTLAVLGNKTLDPLLSDITITNWGEVELGILAEKQGFWALIRAGAGRQNNIPDTQNHNVSFFSL
jgi:hypothetical protein